MLKIDNLNQKIRNHHILKSVSISIQRGKVTVFLGPNGAGKTTLLKTIIGLLPTQSNNANNAIYLENNRINNWSTSKRVEEGLVYLPQQTSLLQQLTVLENLKLIYQHHPFWADKNWSEFIREIQNWFKITGLNCPLSQKAQTLSGGQKRKLEVIRTVLMKPKIAMFDEPFAGVDPKSIYELKEILADMARQESIAVVISDHNVDQLLSIADLIYVLIDGKIVTSGGIKEILDSSKTKDAYFGKQFYTEISQRFLN